MGERPSADATAESTSGQLLCLPSRQVPERSTERDQVRFVRDALHDDRPMQAMHQNQQVPRRYLQWVPLRDSRGKED